MADRDTAVLAAPEDNPAEETWDPPRDDEPAEAAPGEVTHPGLSVGAMVEVVVPGVIYGDDTEPAVPVPVGEIALVGVCAEPDGDEPPDDRPRNPDGSVFMDGVDDNGPAPRLNPALAYDSPEALALYDRETVTLIQLANDEAKELHEIYEERKKEAKEAKEEWDTAAKRISKLIDERRAGRGKPKQGTLFDEHGNTRAEAEVKASTHWAAQDDIRSPDEVLAGGQGGEGPADDEAWTAVPLSDLVEHDGLPEKVVDILASPEHKERGPMSPITTMGELATYTSPEPNGWVKKLTDIKGLGPAKEEAISEATGKFWARWNAKRAADANRPSAAGARAEAPVDGAGNGDGRPGSVGAGDATAEPTAGGAESAAVAEPPLLVDRPDMLEPDPEPAAQPEPEPEPEPASDAEWFNGPAPAEAPEDDGPAGYHTPGVERIADAARSKAGKRKPTRKKSAG